MWSPSGVCAGVAAGSEVLRLKDPWDADALWDVVADTRGGDPSMASAGEVVALLLCPAATARSW